MKKLLLLLFTLITAPALYASEYILYKDVVIDGKTAMAPLDAIEHASAYAVLMHYQFPMSLCHDLEKELDAKELAALDASEENFLQSKMPAGVKVAFVPKVVYELLALGIADKVIDPFYDLLYNDACAAHKTTFDLQAYYKSMIALHHKPESRKQHWLVNTYIIMQLAHHKLTIKQLAVAADVAKLLTNCANHPVKYDANIKSLIALECEAHSQGKTLLYRGTDLLPRCVIDSTINKDYSSHSISYGHSFFSGFILDNHLWGACPYQLVNNKEIGYALSVSTQAYRRKELIYHLVFIPPLSTLMNLAFLGEDYHPRSKVMSLPCTGCGPTHLAKDYILTNTQLFSTTLVFEKAFQDYLANNIHIFSGIHTIPESKRPKKSAVTAPLIKSKL